MKKLVPMLLSGAAITSSLMGASAVSASTTPPKNPSHAPARGHALMTHKGTGMMPKLAVFGEVTAVNGNTVTVKAKNGVLYTVDVSSAKITKGYGPTAPELAVSGIAVGDSLSAIGTLSGTSVAAKNVVDGVSVDKHRMPDTMIMGTIAGINGSTVTVTTRGFGKDAAPVTFTVTTTGATTVKKDGKTSTMSALAADQMIMVSGTIDRTNHVATATSIGINDHARKGRHGLPGKGMKSPFKGFFRK